MKKTKIDFGLSAKNLMSQANKTASDRWDRAEQIVAEKPSGLSPRQITPPPPELISEKRLRDAAINVETVSAAEGVLRVPISLTSDNPRNARKFYDPVIVAERAASLRRDGQMTPAPACRDWNEPGRFILIGGHYRKKGLLANGVDHIEIKLLPASSMIDLYRLSYAENDERQSGTPLDDAFSWQELLTAGDLKTQDEIAAMVSKPRATVTKTLALLTLPETVLTALKDCPDKFTLTAGYELSVMSSLFTELELLDIAKRVIEGDISTRDLVLMKEQRKQASTPRKQREVSRQHKLAIAGTMVGTLKDWDSGKVVLEVVIDDPVERTQLIDSLRTRFSSAEDVGVPGDPTGP